MTADQTRSGGKDIRSVYHDQRNAHRREYLDYIAVWIEHRRRTTAVSIPLASSRRIAVCVCPVDPLQAKSSGIVLATPTVTWQVSRSYSQLGFRVVLTSIKAFHADATYVRTGLCLLHTEPVSSEMNSDRPFVTTLWPSCVTWRFLDVANSRSVSYES